MDISGIHQAFYTTKTAMVCLLRIHTYKTRTTTRDALAVQEGLIAITGPPPKVQHGMKNGRVKVRVTKSSELIC